MPTLSWSRSSWGEVAPPIFSQCRQIRITNETSFLPKGMRLVVRISDSIRDILNSAGVLIDGVDPIEKNEILPVAMNVSDIIRLRCFWDNSRSWSIVKNKLLEDQLLDHQKMMNGDLSEVYFRMDLMSYSFEEVVYELCAYIKGVESDDDTDSEDETSWAERRGLAYE